MDLKFVALPDAAHRVDEPAVLWERDGRLSAVLREGAARSPSPDPQWIKGARITLLLALRPGKKSRDRVSQSGDFLTR